MKKLILLFAKEAVASMRTRLDVWTASKVSKDEDPDFKTKLIAYYQKADPMNPAIVKCMILNLMNIYPKMSLELVTYLKRQLTAVV